MTRKVDEGAPLLTHGKQVPGDSEPPLALDQFRELRDLVNARSGLFFDDDAHHLIERRSRARIEALGLSSFAEYLRYLRFDEKADAEFQELYETLVTKETYFFREDYQLEAFRQEVLPILAHESAPRKQLTCWSVGCSTGEEAYTIAIVLAESGLFDGWDVRVTGTDISRHSLAVARRGIYSDSSFRALSDERRQRFFAQRREGTQVADFIRRMCHFGRMNLVEIGHAPRMTQADAIFCRNVLIYFDPQSRREVIEGLTNRLRPGGFLMLGHSESLLNETTPLEIVRLRGDVVYRKPRVWISRAPPRVSTSKAPASRRRQT
jgi:chemotaxis protein methyltransferase CheR